MERGALELLARLFEARAEVSRERGTAMETARLDGKLIAKTRGRADAYAVAASEVRLLIGPAEAEPEDAPHFGKTLRDQLRETRSFLDTLDEIARRP